jgi:hypothetical protein
LIVKIVPFTQQGLPQLVAMRPGDDVAFWMNYCVTSTA